MSSIAAGTTLTTALVATGDTAGNLVLKTNGTTTALTIGTDQVVTLAQPLPVASGGTGTTSATFVNLATNVTGTLPIANGGTGTTSTTFANLATNVTGTLPVANGGTGVTTLTSNNVILGNGTSAVQFVAPSTNGNVLTSNGTTWTSAAPAGGGSWVYLSTVTASNSATVDVETTFDSTYDQYVIIATGIRSSSNVQLYSRLKIGGSYQTQNYAFRANTTTQQNDNGYLPQTDGNASEINMGRALEGTNSASNLTFYMHIPNPSSTAFVKGVYWRGIQIDGGSNYYFSDYSGYATCRVSASALTGVRFLLASGNITAGTFRLYGIKNS